MFTHDVGRLIGALIVGPFGVVIGLICIVFRRQMARSSQRGADEAAKEDLPRWLPVGKRPPASATAFLVTGVAMMIVSALSFLYALLQVI